MLAGIYVHIPFCLGKCRYCSFNSIPFDKETASGYVDALLSEISACRTEITPTSLYIGGGTPSVLPSESLFAILDQLSGKFPDITGLECTMEANPGAVSGLDMAGLRRRGINRVSLGAQSFSPSELAMLGRLHGPEDVGLAVDMLRRAGIENVGLDLMYSLPGQDLAGWSENIERAVSLGVRHVSIYDLSLEEGTPLYAEIKAGRIAMPPEPLQVGMYLRAIQMLERAGLMRYEISNFAHPGFESAHNVNYWDAGYYLGFGAGAHSHVPGIRYRNISGVGDYTTACAEGRSPVEWEETLTQRQVIAEFMMLGLRKADGVSLDLFNERFGRGLMELFGGRVEELVKSGHAELGNGRLRLTIKGVLASSSVMAVFF
jgi:oxygen-independent coproporphyrinogen-3 oxidase